MNVQFRLASEKQARDVFSPEALIKLIPPLRDDGLPQSFIIDREDGAELIGAASPDRGFLNYFPPGYDGTRSFSSVDELDLKGEFAFDCGGEYSEVSLSDTVERERFELALVDFMQNTGLPRGIAWQRD